MRFALFVTVRVILMWCGFYSIMNQVRAAGALSQYQYFAFQFSQEWKNSCWIKFFLNRNVFYEKLFAFLFSTRTLFVGPLRLNKRKTWFRSTCIFYFWISLRLYKEHFLFVYRHRWPLTDRRYRLYHRERTIQFAL